MYILVDHRQIVVDGYSARFRNQGIASFGFGTADFAEWIGHAADADIAAVEAFLIGDCEGCGGYHRHIRARSRAPILALTERDGLENTLSLFAAGADDVIKKPVDVREILARVAAMRRRASQGDEDDPTSVGDIAVFFDGRDPVIGDVVFPLPRRERRILEFLVSSRGRRVNRTQIFNAVYGVFNDEIDETVIESHISKLRKKLRGTLGRDPIDSKRYLGYMLDVEAAGASELRTAGAR